MLDLRLLTSRDLEAAARLADFDPAANCFVASRIRYAEGDPWRLGGDLLGVFEDGELRSMAFVGANLVPVATTARTRAVLADRLRMQPRRCSSFVGPMDEVLDLWRLLEPAWGPAREVRQRQPLLAIDGDPAWPADPGVRAVGMEELDLLLPACVAMFTEEVGVSPAAGGSMSAYRARVAELIRAGRAFARIDDEVVVFKAEVGAATAQVCQVQGVWVEPRLRGAGLGAPGMAATVLLARAQIAPIVTLYVNDYNTAARKVYEKVGFHQEGIFATVLF